MGAHRCGAESAVAGWVRCVAALLLFSASAVTTAESSEPAGADDPAETRGLPLPDVRPAVRPAIRPLRLPPAPDITRIDPREEIVAGGTITLYGHDLRPADLEVRLGTDRPVALQVLRSTSTRVRVRVPDSAVTPGSPLTVQYRGSERRTIAEKYAVYPRPRFSNLGFRRGPRIGAPTELEVTVSNFSGLEGARLSWWSDCWINGIGSGQLPAAGRSGRISVSLDIRRYDPDLGPTEDLMAVSGRRCNLEASISRAPGQRFPTGLSLQLPQIQKYTIGNTWELHGWSTPSGRTFSARVAGPPGTCEPLSLGTAGSFRIGVVEHHDDISFQLRNGLVDLECEFTTSPRLRVKDGWRITEVAWKTSLSGHQWCHPVIEWVEWAPGRWGQDARLNPEYLDRVRTVARCVVDTRNPARNAHLFRAVLEKIVLIGPPHQDWRSAFR